MSLFDRSQLDAAAGLVHATVGVTPQYAWPLLAKRAGCEVWVKHENHTPTGAFKVRGGIVYLDERVRTGERIPGLITATRGNHGQSVPFAARRYDIPVTVVVPHGNSVEKNAAMRAWGAELVEHGADFDAAKDEAYRLAKERSLEMVPSFHPTLCRGVGTYALELLSSVDALDVVYVPIGMGSGICGLITVRDLLGLKTEIVGVVAENAPAYAHSFAAGKIIPSNNANTFADGMAVRIPDPMAFDVIRAGAARIVTVSDEEIAEAMRAYYADTHNLAEGAGAAPLAALLQERAQLAGRKAAVILCGGNVDATVFAKVLAGETPKVA